MTHQGRIENCKWGCVAAIGQIKGLEFPASEEVQSLIGFCNPWNEVWKGGVSGQRWTNRSLANSINMKITTHRVKNRMTPGRMETEILTSFSRFKKTAVAAMEDSIRL